MSIQGLMRVEGTFASKTFFWRETMQL